MYGFSNEKFNGLLNGKEVEAPFFSHVIGKDNGFYIVEKLETLKVLEKGTASFETFLTQRNRIYNIKGSKYFKPKDELKIGVSLLHKANLIPFGSLFFPFYAKIKLEKGV